jgi:hypothetical protein
MFAETPQEKRIRLTRLGWSEHDIAKACKGPARKKRTKSGALTEYEEQKALIKWADGAEGRALGIQGLLVAIPNSGHGNSLGRAAMLKATGLRTGFPDMILPIASGPYLALAIELKQARDDQGRQRASADPDQVKWIERLRAQRWRAEVCHGAVEAQRLIAFHMQEARRGTPPG